MGASLVYLEKPNKEIEYEEGENSKLRFTAGSMQGWRINMVSYAEACSISVFAFAKLLEVNVECLTNLH